MSYICKRKTQACWKMSCTVETEPFEVLCGAKPCWAYFQSLGLSSGLCSLLVWRWSNATVLFWLLKAPWYTLQEVAANNAVVPLAIIIVKLYCLLLFVRTPNFAIWLFSQGYWQCFSHCVVKVFEHKDIFLRGWYSVAPTTCIPVVWGLSKPDFRLSVELPPLFQTSHFTATSLVSEFTLLCFEKLL